MAEVDEEISGVMAGCRCSQAIERHLFSTVHDVVTGLEYDAVRATCREIARSESKWMSVFRCDACGTVWAEGCYDRGHVMFYYLFPAPRSVDPVRWLIDEAEELPTR